MGEFSKFLSEYATSRAYQRLRGSNPVVNSVGIITACNPGGCFPLRHGTSVQQRRENARLSAQLLDDLRALGHRDIERARGARNGWEDSFMVMNMKRDELLALKKKYGQDAVIWGMRTTDDNGHPRFRFHLIRGDAVVDTREVQVGPERTGQGVGDLFKRGQLNIPFAHDSQRLTSPQAVPAIPEFFIPFIDEPDAEVLDA